MKKALAAITLGAVVIVALTVWYVVTLMAWPTDTVQAQTTGPHQATLTVNTVPVAGAGPHPLWVQYQTSDLNAHQSATIFKVPVDTWVTMIVHQYDSATPLRNAFFSTVQGTKGNIAYWNGKPITSMPPDAASHTFAVPELGLYVPLAGVPANAPSTAFVTMKFTFYSGHDRATYHWQCFDPCGWGTYGNGGPMSTFGYMGGQLIVS
jgi:hypothetical protein